MRFAQGDTVNVKSGGPALTVLSVDGDEVKCLFFSEELGEFREAVIPAFALAAFDPDEEQAEHEDEQEDDEDDEEKAA